MDRNARNECKEKPNMVRKNVEVIARPSGGRGDGLNCSENDRLDGDEEKQEDGDVVRQSRRREIAGNGEQEAARSNPREQPHQNADGQQIHP